MKQKIRFNETPAQVNSGSYDQVMKPVIKQDIEKLDYWSRYMYFLNKGSSFTGK